MQEIDKDRCDERKWGGCAERTILPTTSPSFPDSHSLVQKGFASLRQSGPHRSCAGGSKRGLYPSACSQTQLKYIFMTSDVNSVLLVLHVDSQTRAKQKQ